MRAEFGVECEVIYWRGVQVLMSWIVGVAAGKGCNEIVILLLDKMGRREWIH
jgi:hypothetical protein